MASRGNGETCAVGDRVEAQYGTSAAEQWFVGTVVAVNEAAGTCDVHYEDGDKEAGKPWAKVRSLAEEDDLLCKQATLFRAPYTKRRRGGGGGEGEERGIA
jgi:hypothetical protein